MVDENLSPALAKALNALFVDEHEVIHIRERLGPSVSDPEWIERMSAEGRWIVISGDRRIAKVKAEQTAFRSSHLIGFFLAPALNASRVTIQMQRLLALLEDIEAISNSDAGGAMYELPIKGKIRQWRA
jgi:hypothetical protein